MSGFLFLTSLVAVASAPATEPAITERSVEIRNMAAGDLFAFADRAVAEGRVDRARVLLSALLADRDPDIRHEANFRLAKLDAASGRMREAAVRFRRILDERPGAQPVRLELAAHLARMGDINAARRELRFARAGSLPPEVAQLIDRFSLALRSSRPFGGSLQVGMTADSNINRATRSDTLGTVIGDFTLSEDAKERSGHGLSVDSQAYVRFPIGHHQFTVTGSQSADFYRHKRFDDLSVALKAGPEFSIGPTRLDLSAGVARRWFGRDRFTDSAAAHAILTASVTPSMQGRVELTAARIANHRNPLESGRSYSAGIEFEKALSVRTGIGVALSAVRQDLRDPGYSTRSAQFGLIGYRTLGRMTVIGSASIGRLVADELLLLYPDKRSDWSKRLSLGATFRKIEYMGFSPTAQLSWERNDSSIEIYDYRRRAVELGLTRAF